MEYVENQLQFVKDVENLQKCFSNIITLNLNIMSSFFFFLLADFVRGIQSDHDKYNGLLYMMTFKRYTYNDVARNICMITIASVAYSSFDYGRCLC